MTNSVELLLDLGVDTVQSQRNVERAISNIKTQLKEQLNVNINVNIGGTSGSRGFTDITRSANQATQSINTFNEASGRTATGSRALETALYRANEAIARVARDGSVSADRLATFRENVERIQRSSINTSDKIYELTRATRELNSEFRESASENRLERQFISASQASSNLSAQLQRVRSQFAGLVNPRDLSRLQQEINSLRPPDFSNQEDVRRYNTETQRLASSIRQLGDNAAIASRESQGFLNSFQRSLRTFPAFVASSTLLYGTIGLISDLTTQVIELDTALVSLERVLDAPSYQFDEVISNAAVSARGLSGGLSGL